MVIKMIRIGHGYDVHRLVENRPLVLGGVTVDAPFGLLGHSDADVLLHAVMDALLGAAALGDIGRHFPDNSAEFKDISSVELLRRVWLLIKYENYRLVNLDATLIIQEPHIAPYVTQMRDNIAEALETELGYINIKATTEEGLGFTGTRDGVAAHAVVLIESTL